MADIGGGGLMDIGCYCISLSRFIFDAEPERVWASWSIDPTFETDRLASGMMDFGRGTSTFTCATQLSDYQRVNIFGTEGRIEIEIPFNAPPDVPCKMWHQRGGEIEEIVLRRLRPVHHPGRPVLAGRAQRHPGAHAPRGRGGQHEGDRGHRREWRDRCLGLGRGTGSHYVISQHLPILFALARGQPMKEASTPGQQSSAHSRSP